MNEQRTAIIGWSVVRPLSDSKLREPTLSNQTVSAAARKATQSVRLPTTKSRDADLDSNADPETLRVIRSDRYSPCPMMDDPRMYFPNNTYQDHHCDKHKQPNKEPANQVI